VSRLYLSGVSRSPRGILRWLFDGEQILSGSVQLEPESIYELQVYTPIFFFFLFLVTSVYHSKKANMYAKVLFGSQNKFLK
jgi:hypothetical protein